MTEQELLDKIRAIIVWNIFSTGDGEDHWVVGEDDAAYQIKELIYEICSDTSTLPMRREQ